MAMCGDVIGCSKIRRTESNRTVWRTKNPITPAWAVENRNQLEHGDRYHDGHSVIGWRQPEKTIGERGVAKRIGDDFIVDFDENVEGLQTRYIINYTTGNLEQITDSDGYTFSIADGASPELVGQAYDSANVVMKYISEADLLNYGAVLVEEELEDGETPAPVGEREVEWILDDNNYRDKFGRVVTEPLVDFLGNEITKPNMV